jgi:catechol 2,3-dioxygenase-like lactoylglutathione lyase family enzyme
MPPNNHSAKTYSVHTIALSVANLEHALHWYATNLGFRLLQRRDYPEEQLYTVIIGGVGFQLELIQKEASVSPARFLQEDDPPTLMQGFIKMVIQTHSLTSLYDTLKQNGVTFVYPDIEETPGVWGKWFMIEDEDGNLLQFIEAVEETV